MRSFVVSNPNYVQEVENILVKNEYSKMKKILKGGKERYHSSLAAINAYEEEVNMIFHDAVRPLVNDRIISDCINALKTYNAVDVAIKTTDTIIQLMRRTILPEYLLGSICVTDRLRKLLSVLR